NANKKLYYDYKSKFTFVSKGRGVYMKIKLKDVEQFKKLLLMNGYTQRSYGRAIGISEAYAHQIANGTRNPGPKIAKDTAELLKVDFDDIFYIEDAHKSNQTKQAI